MRQQFDVNVRTDLLPVLLFQQRGFKPPQLGFGGANEVLRTAFPQKINVFLADHTPIHHPNPLGLPILFFHDLDDLLNRGHVGAVATKNFVR